MNQAFETVSQLVAQFKEHEQAYLAASYQESQVRQDFIDRFFAALGWDVTHDTQKNPYEQEVHIENKVHVGASQRRADYAFFLHPNYRDPKFFVEAKKPSRNLANPDDYYQTVRYGWNAGTPIAVLTDFEEFHILDCRFKPSIADALSHKIESFRYSDYTNEEKFSRIYWLFSREAVAGGSLEKRAAELSKPRGKGIQRGVIKGGYQPVDEAFLELLDEYRKSLASAFKKADHSLDGEQLTEAVQRTLDRIVFIRFLEDKQIEEPRIVALRTKPSAWKAFQSECRTLDSRYNGLIFKPHPILDAKEFALPDEEPFVRICDELSDPSSPYNFDQIPISILGSIYERFLGKVIRLQGRGISVEEKPEVRKAGGVYYTPQYIVRYIVNETVGKLLYGIPPASTQNVESTRHSNGGESSAAGSVAATGLVASFLAGGRGKGQSPTSTTSATRRTPEEVAKMSFADIACGSGSFLIEVYAQLLEYHLRYYAANPEKRTDEDVFEREGKLHLTLKKKKEILANNVYGVDIDFQATEVTQLSLYLKLLEDVTMHDAHQFGMFKETILPDLRGNIVCGNSLIGTDIKGLGVTEEFDHLKPMDFESVFPNIFKKGGPSTSSGQGFDAVVGNPPYIRIQAMQEFNPTQVAILKEKYKSAGKGNYDIYVVFVERALSLLSTKGQMGYILPHKFFNAQYGKPLRGLIARGRHLAEIVHFGDQQVFDGATTYTCLLFLQKRGKDNFRFVSVDALDAWQEGEKVVEALIPASNITESEWNLAVGKQSALFEKLKAMPTKVRDIADRIAQGIRTSANEVYVLDLISVHNKLVTARSAALNKRVTIEKEIASHFLQGKEIKAYAVLPSTKIVIIPYAIENERTVLIDQKAMKASFPRALSYLTANKHFLEGRENGRMKGPDWYGYVYPKNLSVMHSPKILVPDIADRASFALDERGDYTFASGYGITLRSDVSLSMRYILGLLNSKVLDFYLKQVSTTMRGGFFRYFTQFIEQLPIRTINFSDPSDKARHDHIVGLVEQMLEAKEKVQHAKTDAEKSRLELQCESLDRQIDDAVYELYGLTEEERNVVEGK